MIVGGIDGVFWDGRYDRENVIGGGSARRASCDSIVQTCPGSPFHNDSTEDAIYDSPVCSREGGVDAVLVSHSVSQP